jgi:hypothetical protein
VLADDLYTLRSQTLRRTIALDLGGDAESREHVLWSPAHPNLIDATISVCEDGIVRDEVQSYFGLRSVGTHAGRFLLNGLPYYLRMALAQGFWPESHLAAPSEEALRREVELAKELGFNGIRVHQKAEDPRFLYWCDRLGLLVWGEMANAYVFTPSAVGRFTREWLEVVERDISSPSVVAWVPLNESWGVPDLQSAPDQRNYARALYALTKALDPSRPVLANDGWEYLCGDLCGIHDYAASGDTIRRRYGSRGAIVQTLREIQPGGHFIALGEPPGADIPIILSEFGGISLPPLDGTLNWFSHGTVSGTDEFCERYRDLVEAVFDSPALAGFCYTQLTDTAQETNGLATAERVPKLDPATLSAITRGLEAAIGDAFAPASTSGPGALEGELPPAEEE